MAAAFAHATPSDATTNCLRDDFYTHPDAAYESIRAKKARVNEMIAFCGEAIDDPAQFEHHRDVYKHRAKWYRAKASDPRLTPNITGKRALWSKAADDYNAMLSLLAEESDAPINLTEWTERDRILSDLATALQYANRHADLALVMAQVTDSYDAKSEVSDSLSTGANNRLVLYLEEASALLFSNQAEAALTKLDEIEVMFPKALKIRRDYFGLLRAEAAFQHRDFETAKAGFETCIENTSNYGKGPDEFDLQVHARALFGRALVRHVEEDRAGAEEDYTLAMAFAFRYGSNGQMGHTEFADIGHVGSYIFERIGLLTVLLERHNLLHYPEDASMRERRLAIIEATRACMELPACKLI